MCGCFMLLKARRKLGLSVVLARQANKVEHNASQISQRFWQRWVKTGDWQKWVKAGDWQKWVKTGDWQRWVRTGDWRIVRIKAVGPFQVCTCWNAKRTMGSEEPHSHRGIIRSK